MLIHKHTTEVAEQLLVFLGVVIQFPIKVTHLLIVKVIRDEATPVIQDLGNLR
jgi:hypothetical protein